MDETPYHKDYFEKGIVNWKRAFIMSLWDSFWLAFKFLLILIATYIFIISFLGTIAENLCPLLK